MSKIIEFKKRQIPPTPDEIRLHQARIALAQYLKSKPTVPFVGVLLKDLIKYLTQTPFCGIILKEKVGILFDKVIKENESEKQELRPSKNTPKND